MFFWTPTYGFFRHAVASRYSTMGRLRGHQDAITCLAVSDDFELLASGGYDGIRLWNLSQRCPVAGPDRGHELRGAISCLTWVTYQDRSMLVYATASGYLVVWGQRQEKFEELFTRRVGNGLEVTAISKQVSFHATSPKLVVGARDGLVQVWTLDAVAGLQFNFSVQLENVIPKALTFLDNAAMDILVFCLHDGSLVTLRGDNGTIVSEKNAGRSLMAHVAVCKGADAFVVDNAFDGFDLYSLTECRWLRLFPTGTPTVRFPKQVAFGENGRTVVGGSDHGSVYVFDRETGAPLDVLRHAEGGLAQTLTTYSKGTKHFVITASSTIGGKSDIIIWEYEAPSSSTAIVTRRPWSNYAYQLLHAVTLLVTLLCAVQAVQNQFPSQCATLSRVIFPFSEAWAPGAQGTDRTSVEVVDTGARSSMRVQDRVSWTDNVSPKKRWAQDDDGVEADITEGQDGDMWDTDIAEGSETSYDFVVPLKTMRGTAENRIVQYRDDAKPPRRVVRDTIRAKNNAAQNKLKSQGKAIRGSAGANIHSSENSGYVAERRDKRDTAQIRGVVLNSEKGSRREKSSSKKEIGNGVSIQTGEKADCRAISADVWAPDVIIL